MTATEALRRLERHPDYLRLIATDRGQALLKAAADEAAEARKAIVREQRRESRKEARRDHR